MNEDRKLTRAGMHLIQHFEGCLEKKGEHYHAYKCPAGVWTVGWGSTHHGGHDIGSTTKWTRQECDAAFLRDMEVFEKAVRRLVKVPLNANRFDSLVSFTYNCGEGNLAKSTLLKKVNAGDFEGAADEFVKWNKANGKVLAGLTRRRKSEALLFENKPDANYDGIEDPKPPQHPMPQAVDAPDIP
jgi:lysozyme